jgi:hypothetical protein
MSKKSIAKITTKITRVTTSVETKIDERTIKLLFQTLKLNLDVIYVKKERHAA